MSADTNEIMMSVTLLNFDQHVINMLDVRNSVRCEFFLTNSVLATTSVVGKEFWPRPGPTKRRS